MENWIAYLILQTTKLTVTAHTEWIAIQEIYLTKRSGYHLPSSAMVGKVGTSDARTTWTK
jgi:hypothetical protein